MFTDYYTFIYLFLFQNKDISFGELFNKEIHFISNPFRNETGNGEGGTLCNFLVLFEIKAFTTALNS